MAFEEELIELIERAIVYAGNDPSRVFVVSIPDWGVMPFAEGRDREEIALQIDAFNAVVRRQAVAFEIDFIDIILFQERPQTILDWLLLMVYIPVAINIPWWANTILMYGKQLNDSRRKNTSLGQRRRLGTFYKVFPHNEKKFT